jgi:hypothetical protein
MSDLLNKPSSVFIGENSLSDECLLELGRITSYLSILEFAIIFDISRLTSLDLTTTLMLFAGDQFDRILRVLTSVFYHRVDSKSYREEFDIIRSELDKINQERNTHLHAIWTNPMGGSAIRTRFSKLDRKNKGFTQESINVSDLKSLSGRMIKADHLLKQLIDRALDSLSDPSVTHKNTSHNNAKNVK